MGKRERKKRKDLGKKERTVVRVCTTRSTALGSREGKNHPRKKAGRERIKMTQLNQSIPVVPELDCNNPVLIIITSGRMRALSTCIKVSAESNHD